jgi:hypothetical protein
LLTEGSSTSAWHTIAALGSTEHIIDICDPRWLCLGRFSKDIFRFYRCPPYITHPMAYLEFLGERLHKGNYDVLLPVHDQVYLLSRFKDIFSRSVGIALPDFEAVRRLQAKSTFIELLEELKLPHPSTKIVSTYHQLESRTEFPCYLKQDYGTAGIGVQMVQNAEELNLLAEDFKSSGFFDGQQRILLQQPACGVLCVVQSVFQYGRLVAAHCYQSRAQGAGGSAGARESVLHPPVFEHLQLLGRHLKWHGALHIEYFYDSKTQTIEYIEANPRIGETMNALMSGLNLCDLLIKVSLDVPLSDFRTSQPGIRTHSLLSCLLGQAQRHHKRQQLLIEIGRRLRHTGIYDNSQEELIPSSGNTQSWIPLLFVCLRLLARPGSANKILRRSIEHLILSESSVGKISQLSEDQVQKFVSPGH